MDLLTALGAGALLIRVGFALYMAGMVRAKNSAGAVLRVMCDLCVASLAFWAIGEAILFQTHNHFLGVNTNYLFGYAVNIYHSDIILGKVFFHFVIILSATSVVSGAVAERLRFFPLCGASVLLAGFLLPICAMWAWGGWLAQLHFFDVAGASAIQMSAGVCAAIAAIVVGPRTGKYNRDGSTTMIPGHNVPLAAVGALLMGIGWIPYVAGSSLAHLAFVPGDTAVAAINVLLCGAAAGVASLLLGHYRYRKPDVILALMGFLGGIVAASAGAARLPTWGAVIIGAGAGILVPMAAVAIDLFGRLDDPAGVIAIYAVGGAWGTVSTALFLPETPAGSRLKQIAVQLLGVIVIGLFSALISAAAFVGMKGLVRIRAREADEFDGLDLAEHDIGAYPDFQQTTIKSYHLREV